MRPLALHHIEHRHAGRIRNIARQFAGQTKADVVLGQQHMAHALEIFRFVIAHPKQLGQRKSGEHRIGRPRQNIFHARRAIDEIDLLLAALVAPDQRRPNHLMRVIQNHQPVHLAGKSDAADFARSHTAFREHAANRQHRCVPPIFRTLLGPQRALHAHVFVRRSEAGANASLRVRQQRARAAGADVDSQPHRHQRPTHGRYAAPYKPASLPSVAFSTRVSVVRNVYERRRISSIIGGANKSQAASTPPLRR